MVQDPLTALNVYAFFRFAFGYPGEGHLTLFRSALGHVPGTLEELRVLYVRLFEAGLPHPLCPLLENYYLPSRPATEVALENKLFYKHFGLTLQSRAAPDHLLSQLEFLSWLEHLLATGNRDRQSLEKAKRDFLQRHVEHWILGAASLLREANSGCYSELFDLLAVTLFSEE